MPVEVVVPKWGLSMQEGLIAHWFKQEGDQVEQGEPLLELETEKMTNVVEAPASGVLARVLHPAGSSVPVSQVIALITAPGEPAPEVASPGGAATAAPAAGLEPPPTAAGAPAAPSGGAIVRAMPAARRLASERGVDLAGVRATGPNGVITREDVERVLAAPHAAATQPTRRVSFYSDGYRLDGLLFTPEGLPAGERRPAVVLCAGYTYLKTMLMPSIARALTAAGYVALAFDYRGFGDSEGPRWRLLPQEQASDARAALTFLADQPTADPARLGALGVSLGGSVAITAAALDRRIRAVVAIEAVGDGARWLRGLRRYWEWRQFEQELARDRLERVRSGQSRRVDPLEIVPPDPASREFLEGVYREFPQMRCELPLESAEALVEFRPESLVERIAPRPVLYLHGDADGLVPVDESRSLWARSGEPRRLEVLPGVGHFDWAAPNGPGFAAVVDQAVGFLRQTLPAP